MVGALFDTNILIDYLNGVPQARDELTRYAAKSISIVTFMEVLIGAADAMEPGRVRFFRSFRCWRSTMSLPRVP